MIQRAKVMQIMDDNMAQVSVLRQSACGENCATCKVGCTPAMHICAVARNDAHACAGDVVTVESGSSVILGFAALVYLLPFVLFFVFYGFSGLFVSSEHVRILLGGAGFLLSVLIAFAVSKKRSGNEKTLLIITRVLSEETQNL